MTDFLLSKNSLLNAAQSAKYKFWYFFLIDKIWWKMVHKNDNAGVKWGREGAKLCSPPPRCATLPISSVDTFDFLLNPLFWYPCWVLTECAQNFLASDWLLDLCKRHSDWLNFRNFQNKDLAICRSTKDEDIKHCSLYAQYKKISFFAAKSLNRIFRK